MKNIKFFLLLIIISLITISCNEKEFLIEEPKDFFAADYSYTEPEHFEIANTFLYSRIRKLYYTDDGTVWANMFIGTDFCFGCDNPETANYGDYEIANSPMNTKWVKHWWSDNYTIIFNANVIISRIVDVEFSSEEQKNINIAEAKFFRAFAYRSLVYLYGGVPIVLEETTIPKRDYFRATREEVLMQIVEDFSFAAENLPDITEVEDGKLSSAAANHYLAETYVAQEEWGNAIVASSKVIDNPNIDLVISRFGRRLDAENPHFPDMEFDHIWDLFQKGNTNRSSNPENTEGIWVMQFETDVAGGAGATAGGEKCGFPRYYSNAGMWQTGDDGQRFFSYPSAWQTERSMGTFRPTTHAASGVWQSDWDNDIRNSACNIQRDWIVENPNSIYYGRSVFDPDVYTSNLDTFRNWRPSYTKINQPGDLPDVLYDSKWGYLGWLTSRAGYLYKDLYMLRVAETYLLRAEAKLGNGDKGGAAADVNIVRTRSNATPATSNEINIDYILDERIRELAYEEKRRLTLGRLDMLVERTRKYNRFSKLTIKDHHNLYPIPSSEIERNTEAELKQNPGYTN